MPGAHDPAYVEPIRRRCFPDCPCCIRRESGGSHELVPLADAIAELLAYWASAGRRPVGRRRGAA